VTQTILPTQGKRSYLAVHLRFTSRHSDRYLHKNKTLKSQLLMETVSEIALTLSGNMRSPVCSSNLLRSS